jgi:rhomboid protease GluP
MVCCVAYLYKYRWRQMKARPLVATAILITLIALMYGLQLTYPALVAVLGRDVSALKQGEVWRMVTPLFIQSQGAGQFIFNMLFLITFLPMAERLFGAKVWALYFVPGVVGEIVNYAWDPHGGGSSPAIFGVMGSLLMYVWLRRRDAPKQYGWFALAGMCGAIVMCFTRDGHGPSLLTGAALAAAICWSSNKKQQDSVSHRANESVHA